MARRTHYDEAHDPSFDFPYSLPSSQASEDSQVSQDSTGSDAAVVGEDEYVVWRSTRADFEDWADFEIWADFWTRRWCRWKCCRCGFINRMPRYELTSGETHMGPGGCCLILVPWEVISAVLE
ncbi:hypothetical protein CH063_12484 [Colletotrichum higginsianum]|uniref:Uncharacterized protein n=1 Tax=Colletotrichum higginsianum (strain IMI 349063) TaxID=759273 RepID=H1VQJ8_COLHI|nr:hypothetical protein CH063_12484 [Colletotrichum higginsianum]